MNTSEILELVQFYLKRNNTVADLNLIFDVEGFADELIDIAIGDVYDTPD